MTTKSLIACGALALVLGGVAYYLNADKKPASSRLNGQVVLPNLDVSTIARIEIGQKLVLNSSQDGWQVESAGGYPADRDKIVEKLLALKELKVGQIVRGKKINSSLQVVLKDAAGKEVANLTLGERHAKWGHGRYAQVAGETVLVSDELDAFENDMKKWCNTRIASISSSDVRKVSSQQGKDCVELERGTNNVWSLKGLAAQEELDTTKLYSVDSALSYLDFTSVVDSEQAKNDLGFATGAVYTVTYTSGSNTVTRIARIGKTVKGGTDRYFKFDDDQWVFTISSYAAEKMMLKRKDLVKAKAEPKVEPKAEPKAETKPALRP